MSSLAATTQGIAATEDLSLGHPTASSRVQLLVDLFGPQAFEQMDAQLASQGCVNPPIFDSPDSPPGRLLNCQPSACDPDLLALSNPINFVDAADPPALLMHGTADCYVPFGQSMLLDAALSAHGVRHVSRAVLGAEHVDIAWRSRTVQLAIQDFIVTELPLTAAESTVPRIPVARCPLLSYTGDPYGAAGAAFGYDSLDSGIAYRYSGKLYIPATAAHSPMRAVILSHGQTSTPATYWDAVGPLFTARGMAVIAPLYTHGEALGSGNLPVGLAGASDANLLRLHKTRALLSCFGRADGGLTSALPAVDMGKIALHGHGAGAYVNAQAAGTYPADFAVASHTAGGVADYVPGALLKPTDKTVANRIRIPYAQYYADQDRIVKPQETHKLDTILTDKLGAAGRVKKMYSYAAAPSLDHATIAIEPLVYSDPVDGVFAWYAAHGM
jgi:fermentation-respiration switch protein FrsA (DUF1100 family)